MKRQPAVRLLLLATWVVFASGFAGPASGVTIDFTTLSVADPDADPLRVGRTHFFDGRLLDASDFEGEQQYHTSRGTIRILFENAVRGVVLLLAVGSNSGEPATLEIREPGSDVVFPFTLPPLAKEEVVFGTNPIREIEVAGRTPVGPAAFGLERVQFTAPTPEPGTALLLGGGLATVVGLSRRRGRKGS